jgi:hypothetical protein
MIDHAPAGEARVLISHLRQKQRQLDAQIADIRAEDRLFHRYGFGSDVHDIKLTALRSERQELISEIARLQSHLGGAQRTRPRASATGWFMVPAVLGALVFNAVFPRRRPTRANRARIAPAVVKVI